MEIINQIREYLPMVWEIIIMIIVLWELKHIVKGIKGGNGVWQIDEVAKVAIYAMLFVMIDTERQRTHEWMVFPLSLYFLLVFSVLVMANLEKAIDKFTEFMKVIKGIKDGKDNKDDKPDTELDENEL